MNRKTQEEIVRDLCNGVRNSIIASIRKSSVPEKWDGIWLRRYITDRFERNTCRLTRSEMREYNNTVAVTSGL